MHRERERERERERGGRRRERGEDCGRQMVLREQRLNRLRWRRVNVAT